MGTRSDIIGVRGDGTWKRIYCHWDGYLDHNGKILDEHYATQDLVEALLEPGDLSSLRRFCDKPEGHTYNTPAADRCTYYNRDRGEDGALGVVGPDLAAVWPESDSWTEFTYVWNGDKWFVADPDDKDSLVELSSALRGEEKVTSLIKTPFGVVGRRTSAA